MKNEYENVYTADFETSVYDGQDSTEVWSVAIHCLGDELVPEAVRTGSSIEDFFNFTRSLKRDSKIYFHNLKFDGSFILSYMLSHSPYFKPACDYNEKGEPVWWTYKEAKNNCIEDGIYYSYLISSRGQWYNITLYLKHARVVVKIYDSLKILPFSVREIGKAFKTKYQKAEMEYKGERHAGYIPSADELDYIKKDVLVMSEALYMTFEEGHNRSTIGSCCLSEFKKGFDKEDYRNWFPNLYDENEPANVFKEGNKIRGFNKDHDYGEMTVGDYIRNSYRGGWCYLVRGKEGEYGEAGSGNIKGTTCDVNSLYPSMMHSQSGNYYPVGFPVRFFDGSIPEDLEQKYKENRRYFFIRIRCRFQIKKDMLPCIMIKDSLFYNAREWLDSSDFIDANGKHYKEMWMGANGKLYKEEIPDSVYVDCKPVLTLTCTDYYLLLKHYDVSELEILDGIEFRVMSGLFDNYINKYMEIKKKEKGAKRQLAKLMLNNLYGKEAASTDSSYNVAFLNENGELRFYPVYANDKLPGYIPIGSAITSYSRRFTITAAQANYYGPEKPGFIYADTDSIHCDLQPDEIKDAPEDPVDLCHWKYESQWDYGYFIRAKRYMEHVIAENREPVEAHYNLLCAGLPKRGKDLFLHTVFNDLTEEEFKELNKEEKQFYLGSYKSQKGELIEKPEKLSDLKTGLVIPGILKAKHIKGGTLLVEREFTMRD